MSDCPHPPERAYAWTYYDPAQEGNYMAVGCTACGKIIAGAADLQGNPIGPQYRLWHKAKRKRKKKEPTL